MLGVLIIPAAHGSTGFISALGALTWSVGAAISPASDLPGLAIKQTLEGIAAARAAGYVVELKGVLWHQGENNSWMSIAAYSAKLDALIAFFRTKLAAPTLPFVIGRMAPEGIALTPGRTNVDKIHQETPARVPFTGFAPSMAGVWGPGAVTLTCQWYRSHGAISGAARAAYTPGPADRGRTITVKVTGSQAGYASASRTSAGTAKVTSAR